MNEEQQKKEVSDLKFSDFQSAGLKFKHESKNIFECFDIGEEEHKDMAKALASVAKTANSPSTIIEGTLNLDVPTKWKIVGILKLGEALKASQVASMLGDIPDNAPGNIAKAMILLGMLGGK